MSEQVFWAIFILLLAASGAWASVSGNIANARAQAIQEKAARKSAKEAERVYAEHVANLAANPLTTQGAPKA